jgi:hypothetical protein
VDCVITQKTLTSMIYVKQSYFNKSIIDSDSKYNKLKEICSNYGDGEWKMGNDR